MKDSKLPIRGKGVSVSFHSLFGKYKKFQSTGNSWESLVLPYLGSCGVFFSYFLLDTMEQSMS